MAKKTKQGKYHKWITKEGLIQLEGWARDGLVDEQIAHNIGIAPSTLYEWKNRYPDITEALKKGKEVVDRQVENALLKRALGYRYIEKKVEESDDGIKTTNTIKEVVPDTTAQIFWLKNRKPEEWRDRRDVSVQGSLDTGLDKLGSILEQLKE